MKAVLFIVTLLLLGVIAMVILKGVMDQEPATASQLPLIDSAMIEELQANSAKIGSYLSWGVIGAAIILQLSAWIAANRKFRMIQRMDAGTESKMKLLENIDVYFDLPLYFGLLGTVLSFILITVFPDAGLMFAYVSTGCGIIVSISLRLMYLTPYRQLLIENENTMAETDAG